jgi:hypothetical protein
MANQHRLALTLAVVAVVLIVLLLWPLGRFALAAIAELLSVPLSLSAHTMTKDLDVALRDGNWKALH